MDRWGGDTVALGKWACTWEVAARGLVSCPECTLWFRDRARAYYLSRIATEESKV